MSVTRPLNRKKVSGLAALPFKIDKRIP